MSSALDCGRFGGHLLLRMIVPWQRHRQQLRGRGSGSVRLNCPVEEQRKNRPITRVAILIRRKGLLSDTPINAFARQNQSFEETVTKRENRQDWLAEVAVRCELLSSPNSLLTGKNTGEFTTGQRPTGLPAYESRHLAKMHVKGSREFKSRGSGKISTISWR